MLFDIHTHVVPNVDDGARSIEESLAILKELRRQGVEKVLATPHFYASKNSINRYLEKINHHFSHLKSAIDQENLPEVLLGSEIYYFSNISQAEGLENLCINGSRYLLLELPYSPLNQKIIDDITELTDRGFIVILAHLERFYRYNDSDILRSLASQKNIECQVNAESLVFGLKKKIPLSLIEEGYCRFLGSDTHNLENRPPYIEKAVKTISKKLGEKAIKNLLDFNDDFYREITCKR